MGLKIIDGSDYQVPLQSGRMLELQQQLLCWARQGMDIEVTGSDPRSPIFEVHDALGLVMRIEIYNEQHASIWKFRATDDQVLAILDVFYNWNARHNLCVIEQDAPLPRARP